MIKKFTLRNPATSKFSGEVTAMLMSSITYCSLTGEKSSNASNTFVYYFGNGWKIVWESWPAKADHYAFVAYDNIDQYMLVIRGSAFTFSMATIENWFGEDFAVGNQVAWQDVLDDTRLIETCHKDITGETTVPQVSLGAARGVRQMAALINEDGQPLTAFLSSIQQQDTKPFLSVTGHSLGASTATAFAQYIAEKIWKLDRSNLSVITFAGPTIGNRSFADRFDSTFPKNSWRYINHIDPATMMAGEVSRMSLLFENSPYALPASKIPNPFHLHSTLADELILRSNKLAADENRCHSHYKPVSENYTIVLNDKGETYPVDGKNELLKWLKEADAQHSHDRYLALLQWGQPGFRCIDDKHKP